MQETKTKPAFADSVKTAITTPPVTFSKIIGKTSYDVSVYYQNSSNENLKNKLLRLMKNDFEKGEFHNG